MSHTYSNLIAHCIYSTKNRALLIKPDFADRLHAYMGGIFREIDAIPLAINGIEDHVHQLSVYPPRLSIAEIMRTVKSNSSGWIREHFNPEFRWQANYTSLSVSESIVPDVKRYIEGQREHHRIMSFKEELVEFLKRNNIPYDERYIWE
jgi:REP element-mobilizing transposase RayT